MKTIETACGMIFEIYESRKEILEMISDCYMFSKELIDDDFALYIEYTDGTHYYISGTEEEGRFKKTKIKTVIESNPSTTSLYGDYRIYNIDDIDEEYNEKVDDESKCWNADIS